MKRTSLNSIIAVSELLVDRLQFLEELEELVYGAPANYVRERTNLHKIVEKHTWLFGEQFHLMTSDKSLSTVLPLIQREIGPDDESSTIIVENGLRDIPDLYLLNTRWSEGSRSHDHLVVELKRPSVRITAKHITQLKRYATQIVSSAVFGQKEQSHRFTFVLVSSEIHPQVRESQYQEREEPGFIGRPKLPHPTELWALQWSDYLDRRREELRFLRERVEILPEPEALEYLRRRAGDLLPLMG